MSLRVKQSTAVEVTSLLDGLTPRILQSWGLLEVVGLFPKAPGDQRPQFVAPLKHLKLVQVPTYGTMVLRNTAEQGMLIAPMHLGFFQEGAQNHATSRTLLLDAGETLKADDCFCIQQSQGGLLKEAQQRFLILPLGLRQRALQKQGEHGLSRLWGAIDRYNRRYGIARGGHLERFYRPYFARLQPFRHAFETLPGQVGAAYFISGVLAGVEVAPNAAYWQELAPILNIYCYGPAALLAVRQAWQPARTPVNLEGLVDLDDLTHRLQTTREQEMTARIAHMQNCAAALWGGTITEERQGLRVITLFQESWAGQMVSDGNQLVYLSVFSDPIPRAKRAEETDDNEDDE